MQIKGSNLNHILPLVPSIIPFHNSPNGTTSCHFLWKWQFLLSLSFPSILNRIILPEQHDEVNNFLWKQYICRIQSVFHPFCLFLKHLQMFYDAFPLPSKSIFFRFSSVAFHAFFRNFHQNFSLLQEMFFLSSISTREEFHPLVRRHLCLLFP